MIQLCGAPQSWIKLHRHRRPTHLRLLHGQWGVAPLATISVTLAAGQCQTADRFNEAAADRRQLRTEVAAETGRLSTAIDGVRTDGERGRTAIRAEVARVGEGVARLEGALGTSLDTARRPMD